MGVLVNTVAIIVGSFLGTILKSVFSERVIKGVFKALGLAVLSAGILDLISGINSLNAISFNYGVLFLVLAIVIGGTIGTLIKISDGFDKFGDFLQSKLCKNQDGNFSQGFTQATLITCVGAMVIYGSIQSGLGSHNTLYLKSILDFTVCLTLSSKYGFSPILSAIPVFVIQGAFYLFSSAFASLILNTAFCYLLTAVGGVIVIAIGINLLEIKKIKTADLLPAILLCLFAYLF